MHVRLIKPWRNHAVDAIVDVSDKTGQRLIDSGSAVLSGPPEPALLEPALPGPDAPESVQPEPTLTEPPTLEAPTVGNVLSVESAATEPPPEELPSVIATPIATPDPSAIPMRHQPRRSHYQNEG
jgi:hypothetical protein